VIRLPFTQLHVGIRPFLLATFFGNYTYLGIYTLNLEEVYYIPKLRIDLSSISKLNNITSIFYKRKSNA
jgi:hypothetical protein